MIRCRADRARPSALSTAFNRCFETLDAGEDLFAPDAFFDLSPTVLAVPAPGPRRLRRAAAGARRGCPVSARVLRVVPTATGFVMEHEETQRGDDGGRPRLWLCEVRDGRITEVRRLLQRRLGRRRCGPGTPPKPRCCGREREDRDDH